MQGGSIEVRLGVGGQCGIGGEVSGGSWEWRVLLGGGLARACVMGTSGVGGTAVLSCLVHFSEVAFRGFACLGSLLLHVLMDSVYMGRSAYYGYMGCSYGGVMDCYILEGPTTHRRATHQQCAPGPANARRHVTSPIADAEGSAGTDFGNTSQGSGAAHTHPSVPALSARTRAAVSPGGVTFRSWRPPQPRRGQTRCRSGALRGSVTSGQGNPSPMRCSAARPRFPWVTLRTSGATQPEVRERVRENCTCRTKAVAEWGRKSATYQHDGGWGDLRVRGAWARFGLWLGGDYTGSAVKFLDFFGSPLGGLVFGRWGMCAGRLAFFIKLVRRRTSQNPLLDVRRWVRGESRREEYREFSPWR
ncbi:hypothetical protein BKA93DRAFT_753068 [Sparassis latifolia]